MPRRKKQSDFDFIIECLLEIGEFIGECILFIFKGIFSLLNSSQSSSSQTNHKFVHIERTKPSVSKLSEKKEWDLELLNELEWKRFEEVVSEYYRIIGYRSEVSRMGADGGVDVLLYQQEGETPVIIIQCKSWSKKVGVNAVRELYGVMAADQVGYGIFATTSDYTNEAREWVEGKSMQLLSGTDLVTLFNRLADDKKTYLIQFATFEDYSTPTCPNCNQKMVSRTATKGKSAGSSFWGCANYPRCKQTFKMV
jgi:restriction system protein